MENKPKINYVSIYRPYEWQKDALRDKSPVCLLTGGAGGGKSRAAAEKLVAFAMKYSNATCLVLRKNRESMVNSTLLQIVGVIGSTQIAKHNKNEHRFEFPNGSIIAYGGMKDDAQRQQIRSIGKDGSVDFAWMEEANAFNQEDFNEVLARMRGVAAPWRQILLSTN